MFDFLLLRSHWRVLRIRAGAGRTHGFDGAADSDSPAGESVSARPSNCSLVGFDIRPDGSGRHSGGGGMSDVNTMTAEILETSAAGFASAASAMLEARAGEPGGRVWTASEAKSHLTQRVLELAAAVRVNDPGLFLKRVSWLRRALAARGADEGLLRSALESLKAAVENELPETLRPAVEPSLELALESLDGELEPETHALDPASAEGRLALEYLTACLEAQTDAAKRLVLDAVEKGLPPQHAYTRILLPAEREVGQLWHVGEVSVAEEHLVTETTRELMVLIAALHAPAADPAKRVLLASVAGNAHTIGLRAAADLFRLAGWQTLYLGANVPNDEIALAVDRFGVGLAVLTATLTTQLNELGAVIARIRQEAKGCGILVGGLALRDSPQLWLQLGADACAEDLEQAVAAGERLIAAG
jgi:MerR family transcriptional regulator, light-induced transcriptional regulator